MCGIFGISAPLQEDNISERLRNMRIALNHRGPDEWGIWSEDGFGFGNCRLSIIDVAGGKQPFWNHDKTSGIVYNGEIYNYLSLKQRMEQEGITFHTRCDTEVALNSMLNYGVKGICDWVGMFGLAFWEREKKKLTLVRDRLGQKPLYYYWDGKLLIFASEIKSILASGLIKKQINNQAIWDYLTYHYIPEPITVWQNIYKLPPGHTLTWSPGEKPEINLYWDNNSAEEIIVDDETCLAQFTQLFQDALNLRIEASDFPVGALLSGGLDSSSVVATAKELGHDEIHAFAVGFEDSGSNSELPYAREVAKAAGVIYHEIIFDTNKYIDLLPTCLYHMDEPVSNPPIVALYEISRLANQHVKVLVGGEGADEILGGYSFQYDLKLWNRVRSVQKIPSFLLKPVSRLLSRISSSSFAVNLKYAAEIPLSEWNSHFLPNETKHFNEEEKILLWPSFKGQDSLRVLRQQYQSLKYTDPLKQALAVWQKSWLTENLLMSLDKMGMANSVEIRSPFMDHRLVEWANGQANKYRVSPGSNTRDNTKVILRKYAQSRLPSSVLNRPKQGFYTPCYHWLSDHKFSEWVKSELIGAESKVSAAFDGAEIDKFRIEALNGNMESAIKVWMLMVLNFWLGQWNTVL